MKTSNLKENRRNFLKTMIPVGGMLCIGCPSLLGANTTSLKKQDQKFSERIQTELSITHEKLFDFRYGYLVQLMKRFAKIMGRDKLITMLKKASDDFYLSKKPNLKAKSVKDFINPMLENDDLKIRLDMEVVELTDKVCQFKITNCLYAKTYRKKNAGDIGYANACYGDYLGATAFNPKLKLERTKTLMEGHDYCDHRYTWNG
jgi:hypothetical protein